MANGRTAIVAIGTLLLGTLVGAWSGRSSQRALEEELANVRAELEASKKQAQTALPLALGLQGLMNRQSPSPRVEPAFEDASTPAGGPREPTPFPVTTVAGGVDRGGASQDAQGMEAIEAASAAWRLRATQSRAAFIEAASLTREQEEALQRVVDQMNLDVKAVVQENLERIDFDKPPQMRDMVDLGVALGEVYQDTDDQLRRVLSEEQMTKALEVEYDIFGQINPDVVMPLVRQLHGAR